MLMKYLVGMQDLCLTLQSEIHFLKWYVDADFFTFWGELTMGKVAIVFMSQKQFKRYNQQGGGVRRFI